MPYAMRCIRDAFKQSERLTKWQPEPDGISLAWGTQGLEVEVQRLINRHRAELEAAHERAAEQVKQALAGAKADHEAQMQALRDRLQKVSVWLLLLQ